MLCRLEKFAVVALLVVSLATPWALLQSVAWVGMLVNYSLHASLADAVSMTFDGKHPCRMCMAIKEGKAHERQQPKENRSEAKDLKLFFPPPSFVVMRVPIPGVLADTLAFPGARFEPPPTPPPRLG